MTLTLPTGTVTFLFTDIERSTRLLAYDKATMRDALVQHHDLLRAAVEAHAGTVFETVGDAVYAAFSKPSDALEAARDAQRALRQQSSAAGPLLARMAVHSGEIESRDTQHYVGEPLVRCARLLVLGHGGQTLISGATAELLRSGLPAGLKLRDLGEHGLKDLPRTEHVYQLDHPDLRTSFPPLNSTTAYPNNLPVPITTFVGRRRELAALRSRLAESRLVTLTGAGGSGKTRLVIELGRGIAEKGHDFVEFIDLTHIGDREGVDAAVVGIGALPSARHVLLILDNCEHIVEICAEVVQELLLTHARLRIVTTSREPLDVPGESVWRIPPLEVPSLDVTSAAGWTRYDAVRLFLERARLARPDFELNASNAPAVSEICRALDGIPLAIELAASRLRDLSVDEIRARVGDRLALLVGHRRGTTPRQRTMRAALEWSYNLLDEAERTVFRRMAIFGGTFSAEAAAALCATDSGFSADIVAETLQRLIEKSLLEVIPVADIGTRYRYLALIREYAHDLLTAAGEAIDAESRCARHLLGLLRSEIRDDGAPRDARSVSRVRAEHDNILAVLPGLVMSDPPAALAILVRIHHPSTSTGRPAQTRRWLEDALGRYPTRDITRTTALFALAIAATGMRDISTARKAAEEARTIAEELGNDMLGAISHQMLGVSFVHESAWDQARAHYDKALSVFRRSDNPGRTILTALTCALVCRALGDRDRAWAELEEARSALTPYVDPAIRLRPLIVMVEADLAYRDGDNARAEVLVRQAIRIYPSQLDRTMPGFLLDGLALLAAGKGLYERALRLTGAADRLYRQGVLALPFALRDRSWLQDTRAHLGARADAFLAAGESLSLSDAIRYAVDDPRHDADGSALTPREHEVAALVARGLTSREIAARLTIAERTAETHVEHILVKLGLRSRAEISTWVAEHAIASSAHMYSS